MPPAKADAAATTPTFSHPGRAGLSFWSALELIESASFGFVNASLSIFSRESIFSEVSVREARSKVNAKFVP